ncbi:MAG: hypothetical protein OEY11_13110 [Gammaproteobacteria bacterium]|nr:hypothetical protein [Gammaproteobacteria bacterium]
MKSDSIKSLQSLKLQSQDNCPPEKANHPGTEISLETLEVLLTSVPDEEISLSSSSPLQSRDSLSSQHQNINKVLAHKAHYLKRLQHLKKRKRGAEWLYRNLSYFQTQFPWELISLLENMAHNKTPDIVCKTLKPINDQSLASCSYYELQNGQLEGLEILTTNIRRLIFNSLENPLKQLTPELIATCSAEETSVWNDWCINIESHIQRIEELLCEGQNFFSIRNFKLMQQLPLSKSSKATLIHIINKLRPA